MSSTRTSFLAAIAAGIAGTALPRSTRAATTLDTLSLDYAYYNPPSLLLKQNGWLEAALAKNGTRVNWVLSLGSNKANSFLAASAVHFGSTARQRGASGARERQSDQNRVSLFAP